MNQQNKRTSTSTPTDLPVKRKRGRPRKDDNLVKKENSHTPVAPASDGMRTNQHVEVDRSADIDDDMVGQVVSGVIEGTFDAGYLLSVRTGNSDTILRGVVFQPGLFAPLTMANDVAPHAKMYKRREFPIPVLDPQNQVNISLPQPEQNNKQPIQLENCAPIVPDQGLSSEQQSGAPFAFDIQSVSAAVPPSDDLSKKDSSAPFGAEITPQQNIEFGLDNQLVSQLKHNSIVKQDIVMQEFEASNLLEGPKITVEATKGVVSESASEPIFNILSGNGCIDQVPRVQHKAVNTGLEPSELVQDELKSSNSGLHQVSVAAKPQAALAEPIGQPIGILMENPISLQNETLEGTQLEPCAKDSRKDGNSVCGNPESDAADNTKGGSQSAPSMMEATPSEPEPAAEESVLQGTMGSQISSSAGHINDGYFVL